MAKVNTICKHCGNEFEVYQKQLDKGKGKFCSISCSTTYRNLINNPSKRPEVRAKIAKNHADVSGKNNPMYGKRGKEAPGYIDGRNSIEGEVWRRVAFTHKEAVCEVCGYKPEDMTELHVHHNDRNRKNNDLSNLTVTCVPCHNNVLHGDKQRDKYGRFIKETLN